MLLAIDTASHTISLALHTGTQVAAEDTWATANNHTIELAPAVAAMLRRAQLTPAELTALAVSIGPGTYSGLRIGVALAKALASARNLPLVGISSLDSMAAAMGQFQGGLIAVSQAGRGRVVAASYRWYKGRWRSRSEPHNLNWETLIATIDGACLVTGEVDADGRAALDAAKAEGKPITVAPAAARLRRAGYLAEEAWARLNEADGKGYFPAAQVTPLYVKTKDSP